jgi:hypothetical protein
VLYNSISFHFSANVIYYETKSFDDRGVSACRSNVRMACKLLYTRRLLSLLKEMTQVLFNKEPLGKREKSLGRFEQTAHMMLDMHRSNGYLPLEADACCLHYSGPTHDGNSYHANTGALVV